MLLVVYSRFRCVSVQGVQRSVWLVVLGSIYMGLVKIYGQLSTCVVCMNICDSNVYMVIGRSVYIVSGIDKGVHFCAYSQCVEMF